MEAYASARLSLMESLEDLTDDVSRITLHYLTRSPPLQFDRPAQRGWEMRLHPRHRAGRTAHRLRRSQLHRALSQRREPTGVDAT